jgi:hypothetical protein
MSPQKIGILFGILTLTGGAALWLTSQGSSSSGTWTIDDELRRGQSIQRQRDAAIRDCYAKGGDRLTCDYR